VLDQEFRSLVRWAWVLLLWGAPSACVYRVRNRKWFLLGGRIGIYCRRIPYHCVSEAPKCPNCPNAWVVVGDLTLFTIAVKGWTTQVPSRSTRHLAPKAPRPAVVPLSPLVPPKLGLTRACAYPKCLFDIAGPFLSSFPLGGQTLSLLNGASPCPLHACFTREALGPSRPICTRQEAIYKWK
jgi:hypothetical protein